LSFEDLQMLYDGCCQFLEDISHSFNLKE
jgi:hypothetical protein